MKPALTLLTALLLAPLFAQAQQPTPPAATVHDRFWLFACPPGGDAE